VWCILDILTHVSPSEIFSSQPHNHVRLCGLYSSSSLSSLSWVATSNLSKILSIQQMTWSSLLGRNPKKRLVISRILYSHHIRKQTQETLCHKQEITILIIITKLRKYGLFDVSSYGLINEPNLSLYLMSHSHKTGHVLKQLQEQRLINLHSSTPSGASYNKSLDYWEGQSITHCPQPLRRSIRSPLSIQENCNHDKRGVSPSVYVSSSVLVHFSAMVQRRTGNKKVASSKRSIPTLP